MIASATMTSRKRLLCAMQGGTPDRVPVQLGIRFTEEGLGANILFENIRRFVEVGKREGRY